MAADCHTRLKGLSIIGICTDGRLRLCIGPKSMEISAGQAFMLFAGEKFRLADASPDLKIRLVIFKDEFMRWKGDILRSAGLHETPPCEAHLFTLAGSVLQECVATYESIRRRMEGMGHKLQPEVLRHYLQILIYDLYDSSVSAVQANSAEGQGADSF